MNQLKPQDIVIAVKLLTWPSAEWSFHALGVSLGIGHNQVHLAYKRLILCDLVNKESKRTIKTNLFEFLVHGMRYVFPAIWQGESSGIPTSISGPSLKGLIKSGERIVWPTKNVANPVKGRGLLPIHDSVIVAALSDRKCYEILSVGEALRSGGAREREVASQELKGLILGR